MQKVVVELRAIFSGTLTVTAQDTRTAIELAHKAFKPMLTDNCVDTTYDAIVDYDVSAHPDSVEVVSYTPLVTVDTLSSKLKRLAVAEVCSEHEALQQSDAAITEWFAFVVNNGIALHDDPRLIAKGQPHFVVCEKYEHAPLCEVLQDTFNFAQHAANTIFS